MNRIVVTLCTAIAFPISASADTYWYCNGGDCVGHTVDAPAPYGTYHNPVRDEPGGDLSVPIHRGMYCINGTWHRGWLRPWERSPVIKPSCGDAVYQISQ